ncbi:MAG: type III-A CRISPR-associated RAMP protein Csm4, partial [Anaerovoracaceae bacterium]
MEYELYKLKFKTAVHLGQGRLEEGAEVFHADTLFSALCFEALNLGGEALLKTLVEAAEEGKIKISGGLPYIGDTYYIPKPMIPVTTEASNSVDKKAMKNLTYIPIQQIGEYLNGKLDPTVYVEALSNLGKKDVRTGVGLSTLGENDLFYVETYCFEEDAGLYILVGYDREEERYLMGDLIEALGYSGIGGKRSSGLGQFEARLGDLPEGFSDRLKQESETRVMALNACL